jgi:O-antigen/teichoic acid export membrane protein
MAVFETNANVLMRIVVPKLVREVVVRVLALVVYLVYAFKLLSLDGFVIAFCSVYAVATLINIIYLFSLNRISLKPDFKYITKSLRKDYLLYTLFLIAAALGGAITPSINTFFISAQMGLNYTGIFAIATFIAAIR